MGVTSAMVMRAKLCGACSDGLPREGTPISRLTQSQLAWAAEHEVATKFEIAAEFKRDDIPLSLLSRSGYGYGDGSGDGYGYGDGSGSGDGYGYGDGSGGGYGDGYGYGDGSGDGYGDGYGYGYGSGYGSGYGLNIN